MKKKVFVKFPCDECGGDILVEAMRRKTENGVAFLILRGTEAICKCGLTLNVADQRFIELGGGK